MIFIAKKALSTATIATDSIKANSKKGEKGLKRANYF